MKEYIHKTLLPINVLNDSATLAFLGEDFALNTLLSFFVFFSLLDSTLPCHPIPTLPQSSSQAVATCRSVDYRLPTDRLRGSDRRKLKPSI